MAFEDDNQSQQNQAHRQQGQGANQFGQQGQQTGHAQSDNAPSQEPAGHLGGDPSAQHGIGGSFDGESDHDWERIDRSGGGRQSTDGNP